MKKLLLLSLLFVLCLPLFSKAQGTTGGWNIDVGPNVAIPIRNLSYFTTLGIGGDIAATTKITNEIAVGARANDSFFLGKTPLLGSGAHGANVFSITADGSYTLPQNVFVGVDLGLGHETTNGQNDTEFARIFNLGYKWDQSKERTYIFTIYFDQTTYEKCLGLRAAIRLK